MVYQCKTSICTFTLRQLSNRWWDIFVDDECFSGCSTIEAAIDDIRCGVTGHEKWDNCYLEAYDEVPEDIREWEVIG